MDVQSKQWFRIETNKLGTISEMIELPYHPITPEAVAEVIRCLLTHGDRQLTIISIVRSGEL